MDREPSEEKFVCINIRDFLNPEESSGIGENDLEMILSNFLVPNFHYNETRDGEYERDKQCGKT